MYRKATLQDEEAVYRLICELEQQALPREAFGKIYRQQLQSSSYECLVCEQQGQVAAVLNMRVEQQLHHAAAIAEIMEFVVLPQCRGQGAGREMLAFACERARARGCVQIEAASNKRRADAHRFYRREGMQDRHFTFSKLL